MCEVLCLIPSNKLINRLKTSNERSNEENEVLNAQTQAEAETGLLLTQDKTNAQVEKPKVLNHSEGGQGQDNSKASSCHLCRGLALGLIGTARSWRDQDTVSKWVEERHPPSLMGHRSMLSGSSSS